MEEQNEQFRSSCFSSNRQVNDESATERNFISPCFSVFPGRGVSILEPCQTPTTLVNTVLINITRLQHEIAKQMENAMKLQRLLIACLIICIVGCGTDSTLSGPKSLEDMINAQRPYEDIYIYQGTTTRHYDKSYQNLNIYAESGNLYIASDSSFFAFNLNQAQSIQAQNHILRITY